MESSPVNRNAAAPPESKKCVWMTAGVLQYQLCDCEFDCDRCALDQAIRSHFGRPEARRTSGHEPTAVERWPADRLYSHNHCWIRTVAREADGSLRVRVGLEPDLARALLVPKAAVLPSTGDRLRKGQIHWWIVTEGGTFPIAAPLGGEVVTINATLAAEPHRMGAPTLDDAWAYELRICDSDLKGARLMRAAEATKAYGADADRFRDSLAGSLRGSSPEVGPTLADGGLFLQHISDMIGAVKYFGLLRQLYG